MGGTCQTPVILEGQGRFLPICLAHRTPPQIHKFETAGLGKAPFKFVGVEIRTGPVTMDNGMQVGSPGQPMGTCAYCGRGIAECCLVQSSDGNTFIVGNVCVYNTGDAGLVNPMETALRKLKRGRKHERDMKRIEDAKICLEKVRPILDTIPSPQAWRAAEGDTLADWCDWMMVNAGISGKLKTCRVIEQATK